MRKSAILLLALLAAACGTNDLADIPAATPEQVVRVEPLSWWIGMKTPLQLMIQGKDLASFDVSICGAPGVKVVKETEPENPDFLFADIRISPAAKPGVYTLVFTAEDGPHRQFKYPYILREREKSRRDSFSTADLIYLIMPDRFANGDPSNDDGWPSEAKPYDDGSAVAWRIPEIKEKCDREVPLARHGGDIQGVIDHLDYLEDLGVTALWSTPMLLDNQDFESYHGYACGDYYHIDPRFGDNALYKSMVEKAHEKGIKVIMDIVTNHCGTDHWWMQGAPCPDWVHHFENYTQMNAQFSVYMDTHASKPDRERQESGWFVPSMPDMNLDNPYVLKYFQQWAVWWVEYAGLDGLRVDTYPYNEPVPMSLWCEAVRKEYPWINIVGECWDTSIPQLAYWQDDNPNKDGFDSNLPAIMDFPLRDAMIAALCEDNVWWNEGMTRVYNVIAQDFAYKDMDNMMIFFANHDHPRTGDILRADPAKMKLAIGMLATLRGIPQLYYGDEMMFLERPGFGNDGSKRIDFPGGWEDDSVNLFTDDGRADAGGSYKDLHDFTKTLLRWRKDKDVIHHGKTLHFLSRENHGRHNITENTYGFFRYDDKDTVFVFVNNTLEEKTLPWHRYGEICPSEVRAKDVISGEEITLSDSTAVPAKSILVAEL